MCPECEMQVLSWSPEKTPQKDCYVIYKKYMTNLHTIFPTDCSVRKNHTRAVYIHVHCINMVISINTWMLVFQIFFLI